MFNRHSRRAGLIRTGFLLLLGGWLAGAPAVAANADTEPAVAAYLNITLPTIAKLKPLIDLPATDRAKAFAALDIKDNVCNAGAADALGASEYLAWGGGDLCRGMIAWMHDDDVFTCGPVESAGKSFARSAPADPRIAQRHRADDVVATRLRLQKAANCAGKPANYWGLKTIGFYDQMAGMLSEGGYLVPPPQGGAVPTKAAFDNVFSLCRQSYSLQGGTNPTVTDAASDGCYAVNYVYSKKPLDACRLLGTAITKIGAASAGDPLAAEAKGLGQKFTQKLGDLGCARTIGAATPASAPPPVAAGPSPRQTLVNTINTQQPFLSENLEVAKRWSDRGNEKEACDYYRKNMAIWATLEKAFADLARLDGNAADAARSKEMAAARLQLFEAVNDTCKTAGNRLYY